nr:MFS transporter [Micromonospora sp. DSM 115978]
MPPAPPPLASPPHAVPPADDNDAGSRAGRTLAVTSIGVFVVFLDATIVNVAFEAMGRSFQSTTASLAWVLNTYSLIFAALLVPAGRLADQYGRKRVFQIGLVGFAATSVVCGLAPTIE